MDAVLARRRDRAIAIILSVKEREVDAMLRSLPGGRDASDALRKVVLDQVNELADLASDLVQAHSGAVVFNEYFRERLEEIYEAVKSSG